MSPNPPNQQPKFHQSFSMFPTISETRFNSSSNGSSFQFNNFHLTGHRSLSEEEQHLYNHHIIENFVESVREMNDVVLIPSKLKDLDPSQLPAGVPNSKFVVLNDDLYSYYQMINVVKNDLFEPHNIESRNSAFFTVPKRKISRREQKNGHTRNLSASSLSGLLGNTTTNGNGPQSNGHSSQDNGIAQNGDVSITNGSSPQSPTPMVPLTSEQLIGQNPKELTVQFIYHLKSLYTLLDFFGGAADFITERYQTEVESAI